MVEQIQVLNSSINSKYQQFCFSIGYQFSKNKTRFDAFAV